jgi:hypothetical protein
MLDVVNDLLPFGDLAGGKGRKATAEEVLRLFPATFDVSGGGEALD